MKNVKDLSKPKYLALRICAFVFFFLLAVAAFAYGVAGLGKKEEGYQEIEATSDEEAVLYAQGFTLNYYFTGSSNAIKQEIKQVQAVYSEALKRAYKLLDKENAYDGYNNLYTLNQKQGEEITVSRELYAILQDAYAKTQENAGYSLFAGAVNDHWDEILYLSEPQGFDPGSNAEEQMRFQALSAPTRDTGLFTLQFGDNNTVTFVVSEEYRKLLSENEVEGAVLDTGLLHDAYMVQLVADALEEAGYNKGYLMTESGITCALSGQKSGQLCAYGVNGEQVKVISCKPGTAFCQLRLYALIEGELGYYTVNGHFRSPNSNPLYFDEENLSAVALSREGRAPETVYTCIRLLSGGEAEKMTVPALVIRKDEAKTVVENAKMEQEA